MSGHGGSMDDTRMNMASRLRFAKFIAAILAMLAIAGCAKLGDQTGLGGSDQPRAVLDNCGDPCTIQNNNGSVIADFENAGNAIRAGARQMLVIDGFCASACMVMADRARPRACITTRAQDRRPAVLDGCN